MGDFDSFIINFLNNNHFDIDDLDDKTIEKLKIIYEYTQNEIDYLYSTLNDRFQSKGFTIQNISKNCDMAR